MYVISMLFAIFLLIFWLAWNFIYISALFVWNTVIFNL